MFSTTLRKFCLLPLPENEADELADNYFCHLHDHGHGDECHQESEKHENLGDLIKSLNPLNSNEKLNIKNVNFYLK